MRRKADPTNLLIHHPLGTAGEEGLAALLKDDWDAVVSDVMLPKLDGLGVIRSARAAGRRVPVIFLSASARSSSESRKTQHHASCLRGSGQRKPTRGV